MREHFKAGDHVAWNSEAGRGRRRGESRSGSVSARSVHRRAGKDADQGRVDIVIGAADPDLVEKTIAGKRVEVLRGGNARRAIGKRHERANATRPLQHVGVGP